jgi:hypothetical protein
MELKVFSCCLKLILPCQIDRHKFNNASLCLFICESQHIIHAEVHDVSNYDFHRQLVRPSGLAYSSPIRILEIEDSLHIEAMGLKISWFDKCRPLDKRLQCRLKHSNQFPLDTKQQFFINQSHENLKACVNIKLFISSWLLHKDSYHMAKLSSDNYQMYLLTSWLPPKHNWHLM